MTTLEQRKKEAREKFVNDFEKYRDSGARYDFGRHIDQIVDHIHAETVRECADIVNGWHIGKGGYTELAHRLQALLPEPV